MVPVPGSGAELTWTVQIPDDTALVGASFYNQAVVLDPSANPAGFVLSDAGRATIGQK